MQNWMVNQVMNDHLVVYIEKEIFAMIDNKLLYNTFDTKIHSE